MSNQPVTSAQETIPRSLQHTGQLLDQLQQLLLEERNALQNNDLSSSTERLALKAQLLSRLEQSIEQRNQALLGAGYPADEAGTQAFFASLPKNLNLQCQQAWQELQKKLEECKNANLVNGKIVHRSRQQVDTLLSLLRGHQGNEKIYTGSGQAQAVDRYRNIAEA